MNALENYADRSIATARGTRRSSRTRSHDADRKALDEQDRVPSITWLRRARLRKRRRRLYEEKREGARGAFANPIMMKAYQAAGRWRRLAGMPGGNQRAGSMPGGMPDWRWTAPGGRHWPRPQDRGGGLNLHPFDTHTIKIPYSPSVLCQYLQPYSEQMNIIEYNILY